MHIYKISYPNRRQFGRGVHIFIFVSFLLCFSKTFSQGCPPNIDFEAGTFDSWTCYTGSVAAINGANVISLQPSGSPVFNRHTMYSRVPGDGVDPYGGFPINCPNGSGHSIKLGNDLGGGQAEGIAYQFTIPAGQDAYTLIYNYAVVFQDPNHREFEQPRMEIEITNVTDNILIGCSSFSFHPYGSPLPGFKISPNPGSETPVQYKDWSPVSISLDSLAGKTIRMLFKTSDCTFRRHFGYAYIDVNSECSGTFVGATYCPDDSAVKVLAPFGYQSYTWYDTAFTQVLGTDQTLTLSPPPPSGTIIAVNLVPYAGYGCPLTLYTKLVDTLTVTSDAGADALSCNRQPVAIGAPPKPGLAYSWSPTVGLSDPNIANPFAAPDVTTTYILSTRHNGGGCLDTDTVIVKASIIDDSIRLIGSAAYCFDSGDSSILEVQPNSRIQWYRDNNIIAGATQTRYRATQSGAYFAMLYNNTGCSVKTSVQEILIDRPRPAIRYPVEYAVINLPLTLQARQFGASVLWNPPTSLNTPLSYAPIFKGAAEQQYNIAITAPSGCVTVDTLLVKTIKNVEIFVPTAFTPNKDGKNDLLRPLLLGVKDVHYFRVFNRWGQLLFETKSTQSGWDGTYKGVPQQTQTVVWMMEGVGVDANLYMKKGTSVLIR